MATQAMMCCIIFGASGTVLGVVSVGIRAFVTIGALTNLTV